MVFPRPDDRSDGVSRSLGQACTKDCNLTIKGDCIYLCILNLRNEKRETKNPVRPIIRAEINPKTSYFYRTAKSVANENPFLIA